MIRVLVVTTVHVPLDARIHDRQLRALVEAGARVTYAAPFSGYGQGPDEALPNLRCIDLPRSRRRDRLRALGSARRLLRARAADHDIVILHDPELLLAVAGQLDRLPPVVWDVHEDTAAALVDRPWVPDRLRPLVARLVRRAESWAERRLHLMLAEESYRERFAREHPVVPNYPFLPADVPPAPGDDRVVYLGRVSVRRGASELIELGERLAGELTVEVLGPADPDVEGALRRADAEGTIRWHGFVPNARALEHVRGATVGLSLLHDEPNYRGSLPTKVLEYLAHGVPVVTTPLPVAVRIVEEADAGRVVPFGDVAAAAAAVRALAADAKLRRAMGQRGRDLVAERYSWDVEGPRFVELLRSWAS